VRAIFVFILSMGLAGCSSNPHSMFVSPDAITGPIYGLKGQSLEAAVAYLGLPDSEVKLGANQRAEIWNSEPARSGSGANNYVTDLNGNHISTAAPYCKIKAVISGNNKIESGEIDANSAFYCPRGKEPTALRGSL
jgi:hypothetical protein